MSVLTQMLFKLRLYLLNIFYHQKLENNKPPGIGLVSEHLLTRHLCLLLVDVLNQGGLVLERVTLGLQVQGVVPVWFFFFLCVKQ